MEKKIKDELSLLKRLARKISKHVNMSYYRSKSCDERNECNCLSDILDELIERLEDIKK